MSALTLEERERRAYADGDLLLTEALHAAIDERDDIVDALVADHVETAFEEGYRKGYSEAEAA